MTDTTTIYRRILRRDIHSPRSTLAIGLAVIAILVCGWIITEVILAMAGQPALLTTLPALAVAVADAANFPAGLVVVVGASVALIGLIIMVFALTPGRRARHVLSSENSAAIVDDEVIASALAHHAARAGHIDPDNVRVDISHRRAHVHVTPTSGLPVDEVTVRSSVEEQLRSYGLSPTLTTTIALARKAKVGA